MSDNIAISEAAAHTAEITTEAAAELLCHGSAVAIETASEEIVSMMAGGSDASHEIIHAMHGRLGTICSSLLVAGIAAITIIRIVILQRTGKLTLCSLMIEITNGLMSAIAVLLVEALGKYLLGILSLGVLAVVIPILSGVACAVVTGRTLWAATYLIGYYSGTNHSKIKMWASWALLVGALAGMAGGAALAIFNPLFGIAAACAGVCILTLIAVGKIRDIISWCCGTQTKVHSD